MRSRIDHRGVLVSGSPDEFAGTVEAFAPVRGRGGSLRSSAARTHARRRNTLHGIVVPPVPYRLRLDVRLETCLRPRLVQATIEGDVRGSAVMRMEPVNDGQGSRCRGRWR